MRQSEPNDSIGLFCLERDGDHVALLSRKKKKRVFDNFAENQSRESEARFFQQQKQSKAETSTLKKNKNSGKTNFHHDFFFVFCFFLLFFSICSTNPK